MDDVPTIDEADKPTAEAEPPRDPANLLGERVGGRYRVIECIGKGGMGVVYRARQKSLDRDVVVKVLPENFLDNPKAVARFEREARGMSRLEHPHVVSTYDFGRTEDLAYICMEYAEGRHLGKRLREGAIPLEEFGPIAVQILEGVSEAHSSGLVHRDLKPSNIMLCERRGYPNWVKLLDFGLAKLVRGSRDDVTSDHKLIGTLSFLSPEQILGEPIDERVDVYALGVLFYVMLSGKKPFAGDTDYEVIEKHIEAEPPPLMGQLPEGSAAPGALITLIHRCLAKRPENRPDDALELGHLLRRAMPAGLTELPWASTRAASWISRSDTAPTREAPSPAAPVDDEAEPDRDDTGPTAEQPWPEEMEPTAQMQSRPKPGTKSNQRTTGPDTDQTTLPEADDPDRSRLRPFLIVVVSAVVVGVGLVIFGWISGYGW